MRRGICPLCRHNEIIESTAAQLRAFAPSNQFSTGLGGASTHRRGTMNVCICRRCGFTQWFTLEAGEIPIGQEYETRLIRGSEPGGPYR